MIRTATTAQATCVVIE